MLGPRNPDDYLLPTERRVIRVRRHWATLLPLLAQTVGLLVVAFFLSNLLEGLGEAIWLVQSLLWYAAFFVVLRFAYYVLEWWVERIVVTDKRFMLTNGILVTNVAMMPITKVTDLTYRRPMVGRVLGYGTLVVESAGQIQALNQITYMPRPEEVYDAISELVFGDKAQGRSPALQPPRRRR
ncbi:MAG: PH domain-containing protein [Pseudonocardiaceae bacterium]|nr:PH domain-containing protein [Pseudonocardiaceae bacterium]